MATRSNVVITDEQGNELWIYRHWDGYPSENGLFIAKTLKELKRVRHYGTFAPLANALVDHRDSGNDPVYEITTGQHGDIEWLYAIKCSRSKVTVTVTEISHARGEIEHGPFTETEFRSFIAQHVWDGVLRSRSWRKRQAA
jgi:hypothetical protein